MDIAKRLTSMKPFVTTDVLTNDIFIIPQTLPIVRLSIHQGIEPPCLSHALYVIKVTVLTAPNYLSSTI